MSILSDAAQFREAIASIVREEIEDQTKDCFRVRKAIVSAAPNGTVCRVHLVGDETELSLPYSSAVSTVSVGDVVWVAILFGSMRNAIVWDRYNFGLYRTITAADLVSGVWNYSNTGTNAARARTSELIPVRRGMEITFTNHTFDSYYGILETTSSPSYLQLPGWQTDKSGIIVVAYDGYLTFNIRNHANTSAAVTPSDFDGTVMIR